MANIQSQVKRNRQNEKRHERNKAIRSEMKTRSRHTLAAAEAGDAVETELLLRQALQRYDVAVSKGVLKKNTAARNKSRLTRQVRVLLG
jgi:small subunit ribosomal protein S20